jgi:hypothetical protein
MKEINGDYFFDATKGYNGRTDWADRADTNGFFFDFLLEIRALVEKNPFQSAQSAQSVLPLYPFAAQKIKPLFP